MSDLSGIGILIVEDSQAMMRLVGSVLKSMGVKRIYTAPEGERGFRVFQSEKPDIVITDWLMDNGMDGITFMQKVRQDKLSVDRTVPIIMMSGYSARKRVIQARDAGVTEFLAKPFTAEELGKRITYVVERPRDFIECDTFVGPDRRRRVDPYYKGPSRRDDDVQEHMTTQIYKKKAASDDKNESSDIRLK